MIKIKVIIPIIIIIIIIAGALIIFTPNEEISKNKIEEKWVKSGPFEIDKAEYNLGEKIFLTTKNLLPEENGIVQFLRPINDTHHKSYIKIPFDGMDKEKFNYYFEPRFQQYKGICSIEDIAGNWIVKFSGTQYEDINFEILAQPSSWDKRTFEPIC
jgi:uncharacterized protein involved in outer membrane biogenesis